LNQWSVNRESPEFFFSQADKPMVVCWLALAFGLAVELDCQCFRIRLV